MIKNKRGAELTLRLIIVLIIVGILAAVLIWMIIAIIKGDIGEDIKKFIGIKTGELEEISTGIPGAEGGANASSGEETPESIPLEKRKYCGDAIADSTKEGTDQWFNIQVYDTCWQYKTNKWVPSDRNPPEAEGYVTLPLQDATEEQFRSHQTEYLGHSFSVGNYMTRLCVKYGDSNCQWGCCSKPGEFRPDYCLVLKDVADCTLVGYREEVEYTQCSSSKIQEDNPRPLECITIS